MTPTLAKTPALAKLRGLVCGLSAAGLASMALGCSGDDNAVSPPDAAAGPAADAKAQPADATVPVSDATAGGDATVADADSGDGAPYLGSMPVPATMALLRFANWSADAPAVDVCVAPHGTGSFQGPLLYNLGSETMSDAGANGLGMPGVSAYTLVAPGQYDARVVVGGSTSCAVGIIPDATGLMPVAAGGAETIALIGDLVPAPGAYAIRVSSFLDDVEPTATAAIRAINAVSGMAAIDVGTGSLANGHFAPFFQRVALGMTGQPSGASTPSLVDSNGYLSVAEGADGSSSLANVLLSAHASGTTTDAVVSSAATTITAGSVVTLGVVGDTNVGMIWLVECFDNAGTSDVTSDCIISMTSTASP